MIGEAPLCVKCKHLINELGPMKCAAYPDGIPEDILNGDVDHRKPHLEDNGIQFEAGKHSAENGANKKFNIVGEYIKHMTYFIIEV